MFGTDIDIGCSETKSITKRPITGILTQEGLGKIIHDIDCTLQIILEQNRIYFIYSHYSDSIPVHANCKLTKAWADFSSKIESMIIMFELNSSI
jgi:hypothetical protein